MSVDFKKNGIISSNNIHECKATNVLLNSENYTINNPYILSGTTSDLYKTTNMYQQVSPNETYYLCCNTDSEWSPKHGSDSNTIGKATIWLYEYEVFDPNSTSFTNSICFKASNMIANGIWKYTVNENINMVKVRLNTYTNGTDKVTCKFWDILLIPEKYYINPNISSVNSSMKIGKDFISSNNIYEL